MGKRSDGFARNARDFYPTPRAAIEPLLPFLRPATRFYEPAAGDGALAAHLVAAGHICTGMSDIEPQAPDVEKHDAMMLTGRMGADCFITNPPWGVAAMHPLIRGLTWFAPTWLLLYGDWLFTRQAVPFLPLAAKAVAVGRVKWIPDSPHTGKDNAVWVLFDFANDAPTQFFGRAPARPGVRAAAFYRESENLDVRQAEMAKLANFPARAG
jgi:hypothetical protein